jgi:hypothetical protein
MAKLSLTFATAVLLTACHSGQDSLDRRTLKAETDERARKNAEQDAIQAQRQLNFVAGQTLNGARTSEQNEATANLNQPKN